MAPTLKSDVSLKIPKEILRKTRADKNQEKLLNDRILTCLIPIPSVRRKYEKQFLFIQKRCGQMV